MCVVVAVGDTKSGLGLVLAYYIPTIVASQSSNIALCIALNVIVDCVTIVSLLVIEHCSMP